MCAEVIASGVKTVRGNPEPFVATHVVVSHPFAYLLVQSYGGRERERERERETERERGLYLRKHPRMFCSTASIAAKRVSRAADLARANRSELEANRWVER